MIVTLTHIYAIFCDTNALPSAYLIFFSIAVPRKLLILLLIRQSNDEQKTSIQVFSLHLRLQFKGTGQLPIN